MKKIFIVFYVFFCLSSILYAQKSKTKIFFKRQNDYIQKVIIDDVVILKKRIPKELFPKVSFIKSMFFDEIENIQKTLDKIYEEYAKKSIYSYYWEDAKKGYVRNVVEKCISLKKQDKRFDVEPYLAEWKIYDNYFTQKENEKIEKFINERKLLKIKDSTEYVELKQLTRKNILSYLELEQLKKSIDKFADSTLFREDVLMKMVNAGSSIEALEIQEKYISKAPSHRKEKERLLYESLKKLNENKMQASSPQTSPITGETKYKKTIITKKVTKKTKHK